MAEGRKRKNGAIRKPARLAAGLAEWARAKDSRELQDALRRVGLEVVERKPDHHYVHQYYGRGAHKLRSGLEDEEFLPIATDVWEQGRTYLYYDRLYTLYQALRSVARRFPSGDLLCLEAGVYQGGSAYFLARAAERFAPDRARLIAVDTFGGHGEQDLPEGEEGAHSPGKFDQTSAAAVREYLSVFDFAEVREGRIQDIAPDLPSELHLVHVDVDIYVPTRFTLDLVAERLLPGGIAIVDDCGFTTCPGVRKAVEEFADERAERFVVHALDSGQALVVRTA